MENTACFFAKDFEAIPSVLPIEISVGVSAFFHRLRMNRDAGDLREIFLYAVFEGAGDVVDLGDG